MLEDVTFEFQPTLNVMIGANNTGKTAVIDALRIILNLGSFQGKEDMIRLKESDICRSLPPADTKSITFEASFYGKSTDTVLGQFYEMDANQEPMPGYALFQLRHEVMFRCNRTTGEYRYHSSQTTGGQGFQNPIPYEPLDAIKSIYLAPLRDVLNDSSRLGREVERLLYGHGDGAQLQTIPSAVRDKAEELISSATNGGHEAAAGKNLSKYASMYGFPENSLKFIPAGLSADMLRSLQIVFEHGYHGASKLGLASNGLGINNLIYASVVLSRASASQVTDSRRFFLIEEPEAHLHPQSQESFFHELNENAAHQIFVSSHSPTITAKCNLEKIIVMILPQGNQRFSPCHLSQTLRDRESDRSYLHKFLDVTRSQLLFAKGVVFVEGVTEAMLLELFAVALGCSLRSNGVEIITLGSNGGFEHFRTLIADLGIPCAFLTDGDQAPTSVPSVVAELKARLGQVTPNIAGNIRKYTNLGTFEFELLLSGIDDLKTADSDLTETVIDRTKMRTALSEAMKAARGASQVAVNQAFAADFMDFGDPALAYRKMKQENAAQAYVQDGQWAGDARTNSKFVGMKSEFAYQLLVRLGKFEAQDIAVPPYIAQAIRYVTGLNGGTPVQEPLQTADLAQ